MINDIFDFFSILFRAFLGLWPISLPLVSILCYLSIDPIKSWLESKKEKRNEEQIQIVAAHSSWCRDVRLLNKQTKYYTEILNGGHSVYVKEVDNKGKFDRTMEEDAFLDFLSCNQSDVECALERVYRNRVIYEVYCKNLQKLGSSATLEQSEALGIKFEKYLHLERMAVAKLKLPIIHRYGITCYIEYTSPQGRNSYSKHSYFDEKQIRKALVDINKKNEYHQTETFRRKNERSKVTPSLRYDVMRRDGFRCRLCGRSAESGVELEVDHIVPVSKGGSTTYENLQTLCRDCNRGKAAKM